MHFEIGQPVPDELEDGDTEAVPTWEELVAAGRFWARKEGYAESSWTRDPRHNSVVEDSLVRFPSGACYVITPTIVMTSDGPRVLIVFTTGDPKRMPPAND